jgi:putative transposase
MPWGLRRFHETGQIHFITASCYHRQPNFSSDESHARFPVALERVRIQYRLCVYGCVVIPEHVHLLISEPEEKSIAT